MTLVPTNERKVPAKKWSKLRQACRGAAIAEANRERAKANRGNAAQWTATEYKIVNDIYPDYEKMKALLPDRTITQIRQFAQNYGIAKKRHVWTTKEVDTLKRAVRSGLSTAEIYHLFPGFTQRQVHAKANHMKLKWPEIAPVMLGVRILDEIRTAARGRNISMIELDDICENKRSYWSKACKNIRIKDIFAALAFLEGELSVHWKNDNEVIAKI